MTRVEHLMEAAEILRDLFCGDTVHMGLAGNPKACAAMEDRIARAVANASPFIGPATTASAVGTDGSLEPVVD